MWNYLMIGYEKIVEERILNSLRRGEFDNLPGSGKPLTFHDDSYVPEDLRLAYKILKNANFLPPELEIKREIRKTEDLLSNMKDTKEKYRVLKKLNHLIMKYNVLHGRSLMIDIPQHYQEKLIDNFENNKQKWLIIYYH